MIYKPSVTICFFQHSFLISRILLLLATTTGLSFSANWPNIVAIISEDMGPDLGCWGAKVHTPHIDPLATSGMRFTHCFGTASVCMPNRTAMITGMYQPSIGSVTMRPPAKFRVTLPEGIAPLPHLLRNHGYRTANIVDKKNIGSGGKDDWNFNFEGKSWDTKKLADLTPDKPFYAQFNFPMAHRPFRQDKEHPIDPATVDLPPYYPDHPVARQAWSDYLESIQNLDRNVGKVLAWLEEKKLTENTIIFCYSDHGEAFLRGKYWLYDCSLNQHLIIRWPDKCQPPEGYQQGGTSSQLISAVDIMAQTLVAADHPIPAKIHARPFLGDGVKPRSEIYSASDWIGGSKIKSRSIRNARYKYIRNYNTDLSITSASTEYRKVEHPMFHLVNILAEQN